MSKDQNLLALSAIDLRDRLADGNLSAVDLSKACIARIEAREDEVRAWIWFDAAAVLQEAERLDALKASGAPLGSLHGLPVGVKDVIDTAGIPTENGCPVDAGRVPQEDAEVVRRLKEAGAIMFGKTVTTELAFLHPNKTRNPRNLQHTPGGSSSGSAAAVADRMVPLAIGTQTGGSVVRPASFCGVVGLKPSFDAIPRKGTLLQSHSLDTLGVFANDPAGAALLADVLSNVNLDGVPKAAKPPILGFVALPGWDRADPVLHAAIDRLRTALSDSVIPLSLPDAFDDAARLRAVINTAEMGHYFKDYLERGANQLGSPTRVTIEEGLTLPAVDYLAAKAFQDKMEALLEPLFERCDGILCPAALGPAPAGLSSTGDSIFNGLWTMAGNPAITLPLLETADGLPMGVQLVGRKGGDSSLLAIAHWMWSWARHTQ
ncbi:amidase [uncultured Roseibium sp.]|uniref:amidase n=1 Tax=uncultured Roseibium sp. TaxID=1936171 RepID=UPI0026157EB6|nr:amidase [uncultured Roseibium sp.]